MGGLVISGRQIGVDAPCYIIAEMSANHAGKLSDALEIIKRAKEAGADAIKIQTYTPDTITIDSDAPDFQITQGTIWDGTTLYKLYEKAYTPREWHGGLFEAAAKEGITIFSSPFDLTAVDFLEGLNTPAYKIASFEINDIPLIKKVAETGKPVIISTGIARLPEIYEALEICRDAGNESVALLKCASAYPTPFETLNLRTIPDMAERFGAVVGLSDHTLGETAALGAVALGAKIIEKHFTLCRAGGVDASFSMEPSEFGAMVKSVREFEKALGTVTYELSDMQLKSREHSRSLYAVSDIAAGEALTELNVRSVRPAFGLHTRHYGEILGKRAKTFIKKGTRMSFELFD